MWFFSSCGWILDFERGIQASSSVSAGKSNLPFKLRSRAGGCARVTAGQNRPHLGLCPGPNVSSPGARGIWVSHSRLTRGIRTHLEGKKRTLLSVRVTTNIALSPLSGLKEVKPPVELGEKNQDCSPGHAGKEGPHLAMTGVSHGFSRTAAPL